MMHTFHVHCVFMLYDLQKFFSGSFEKQAKFQIRKKCSFLQHRHYNSSNFSFSLRFPSFSTPLQNSFPKDGSHGSTLLEQSNK